MKKGMRCVPETTERLSVSGFTVVWLIKAGEPKAQRMLWVLQCCSVAAGDGTHFFSFGCSGCASTSSWR